VRLAEHRGRNQVQRLEQGSRDVHCQSSAFFFSGRSFDESGSGGGTRALRRIEVYALVCARNPRETTYDSLRAFVLAAGDAVLATLGVSVLHFLRSLSRLSRRFFNSLLA
jgi:hypothetical protein